MIMEKVSRNTPCPCGSGKKYKNCHMKEQASKSGKNKAFIMAAIIIILTAVGIFFAFINSKNYNGGPGPAPDGKVWSAEHGHWHDAP